MSLASAPHRSKKIRSHLLRRRWKVVAASCLVVWIVGFALIFRLQPTYETHTSLLVDPPKSATPESSPKDFPAAGAAPDYSQKTQLELLKGSQLDSLLARQLKAQQLSVDNHLFQVGKDTVQLSARIPNETELIVISAAGTNPQLAAKAANQLASDFLSTITALGVQGLSKAESAVRTQVTGSKRAMDSASARLQQLKQAFRINNIDKDIETAAQDANDLQTRQATINADLAAGKAELAQLRKQYTSEPDDLSNATTPDADPLIQTAETHLAELESQLRTKSTVLTPKHPEIIALNEEIRSAQLRIKQLRQSSPSRYVVKNTGKRALQQAIQDQQARLSAKQAEFQSVGVNLVAIQGRLKKYPAYELQFAEQERLLKSATDDYERFRRSAANLAINRDAMTPHVRVVEPAAVPLAPQNGNRNLLEAMVVLLGILIGIAGGLVGGTESLKLTEVQDIERYLPLEPIAVVPMLPDSNGRDGYLPDAYPAVGWILLETAIDSGGLIVAIACPPAPADAQALVAAVAAAMAATGRDVVIVSSTPPASNSPALPGRKISTETGGELAHVDGWTSDEDALNVQNVKVVKLFLPVVGSEFFWGSLSFSSGLKRLRKPGRLVILDASSIRDETSLSLAARECDETFLVVSDSEVTVKEVNRASQTIAKGGKAGPRYIYMPRNLRAQNKRTGSNATISENAKLILDFVLGKQGSRKD